MRPLLAASLFSLTACWSSPPEASADAPFGETFDTLPSEWLAPPAGPDLTVTWPRFQQGQTQTVYVGNASPGQDVYVLVSTQRGRACPQRTSPVCLDVGTPFSVLGSATAGPNGLAQIDVTVPTVSGTVVFEAQAVAVDQTDVRVSDAVLSRLDDTGRTCAGVGGGPSATTLQPIFESYNLAFADLPMMRTSGQMRVISTPLEYNRLRNESGAALPSVDFAQSQVVVLTDMAYSTCGMNSDSVMLQQNSSGPALRAALRDESRNCCIVCDALGGYFELYTIPRGDLTYCEVLTGGCTGGCGSWGTGAP